MSKYKIKLRGYGVALPHGGLPEIVSPYMLNLIEKTGGAFGPLGKQFIAQPKKEKNFSKEGLDPLNEEKYKVAPGVIYKYKGRVVWTITNLCGSYCRFCTRGRIVGVKNNPQNFLSDKEIEKVFEFLKKKKEIKEVILSGGEPLICPQKYLTKIITGLVSLQKKGQIDIIRIGTRTPINNPKSIKKWHYDLLSKIKNPYIVTHINHPAELTKDAIDVFNNFRKISLASILCQTVLLKGVNDSTGILCELFNKLAKEGIHPYYLFQNEPNYWAKHFTVPIKKAINIWKTLRRQISGVAATAKFVIDIPNGCGKIPLPEADNWDIDLDHCYDFNGKKFKL